VTKHRSFTFKIRPSKWLYAWIVVLHSLALLICWLTISNFSVVLFLTMLIFVSYIYHIKVYNQSYQGSLKYQWKGKWSFAENQSPFKTIQILPESVLTPLVIILHFKQAKHKKVLLISRDTMPVKAYKRLMVMLKTTVKNKGKFNGG